MKTLAGIVLYNPDIKRLRENIDAIIHQVDCLLLIENGSDDLSYREQLKEYTTVLYVNNHESKGIAYALNQICGYAYTHGYKWALTLDQDSVATPGMIDTYKDIVNYHDNLGILGCKIEDRNFKYPNNEKYQGTFDAPWVITSAAFTNTEAWYKCGGFDNEMFIDFVDADICYNMKRVGYKTMVTCHTKLIQEIGKGTSLKDLFLLHELRVDNHPAMRKFFGARNSIYLTKKYDHVSLSKVSKFIFKMIVGITFYESAKIQKLWAVAKGISKGIFMVPKYQHITDIFLNIEADKI